MKFTNSLNILTIIFLTLVLICLSSCDCASDHACPRCIAADDFGTPKKGASASKKSGDQAFKSNTPGESSDGKNFKQVIRWEDTGFTTDGGELFITIRGRWSSWYGSGLKSADDICTSVKNVPIADDKICQYEAAPAETVSETCKINGIELPELSDHGKNYPCWLTNGQGLYLLFQRPGDPDPNRSLKDIKNPTSPVIHIGSLAKPVAPNNLANEFLTTFSSEDGSLKDNNDCRPITMESGWRVYVKIFDRFYWDNAGGYSLEFNRGVSQKFTGFFESTRLAVQGILNKQTENIYKNITTNNNYINFVKSLLVLYITITGLTFLLGTAQITGTELIIKVLKIAIIMQLISPSSWNFFYNNLFILFIDGTNELIGIINSHSGFAYDPKHPFAALDKMFSGQGIWSSTVWGPKMQALIAANFIGIIWCFIIVIIILIFVLLVAYAFIIYLTAIVGVSVLIILTPILFLGLLFNFSKRIFEQWFTQALSFSFQAILMYTLISLFSAMIMQSFYRTLGFTTCCNEFLEIDLIVYKYKAYAWTPGQEFRKYYVGPLAAFGLLAGPVGAAVGTAVNSDLSPFSYRYKFTGGVKEISIPPDYKETGCRYVDYPYFNPDTRSNRCPIKEGSIEEKGYDAYYINKIQGGDLVIFQEIFAMLLIAVMMYHMRIFVQQVGAALAGGSPFTTVIGNVYRDNLIDQALAELQRGISAVGGKVTNAITGTPTKVLRAVIPETTWKAGKVLAAPLSITRDLLADHKDLNMEFKEKAAFKEINYVRGLLGYYLPGSTSGAKNDIKWGEVFNGSPKQLNYVNNFELIRHPINKYILKNTDESFLGGAYKAYLSSLEKIHDHFLGTAPLSAPTDSGSVPDGKKPVFKTFEIGGDSATGARGRAGLFGEENNRVTGASSTQPSVNRGEIVDRQHLKPPNN